MSCRNVSVVVFTEYVQSSAAHLRHFLLLLQQTRISFAANHFAVVVSGKGLGDFLGILECFKSDSHFGVVVGLGGTYHIYSGSPLFPPQPPPFFFPRPHFEGSIIFAMSLKVSYNIALLEKYDPPKSQLPSKVHRFPVYQRQKSVLAPASPPAKEVKPVPPPAPKWSNWQWIEEPQWDGYWRASSKEDSAHYPHPYAADAAFTNDKIVRWMDVSVYEGRLGDLATKYCRI